MVLQRPAEALASYDKAIALKPDVAAAHNNRGNALKELKRPAEALASYDKAIALKPDVATAHNNRGNALRELQASRGSAGELRQGDRAQARLRRGVQQSRQCAEGPASVRRKRSRATTRRSRSSQTIAEAHDNRGNALRDLRRSRKRSRATTRRSR